MSYGHPVPSGHGRRVPAYRWSPTVLPPSQRRARRGRYTRHDSYVPRFRFSTPSRRISDCPASRHRSQLALPTREPSLGRLLGKGVVSLAGGILKFLADEALAGNRTTKAFESFLSFCTVLAVMSSSLIGFVLGAFYLFVAYMDDFAGGAAAASMEEYDEAKKRMCITRKTSVEAPPRPEELRRAWEVARGRGSLTAKLLAGTLLSNLEPAVDQSYLRAEDGTIVGRRPGLKGWLRGYCPDLVPHYKALMSYKALADKLRIALGIEEPDTLSCVVDFGEVRRNEGLETSGGASPNGDAPPDGCSKKNEKEALDGSVAKDAGKAAKNGRMKPKSLKFRKRFRLTKTSEQSVIECIHTLFADQGWPGLGSDTAITGATGEYPGGQTMEGKVGKNAKTSVFSVEIDTMGTRAEAAPRAEPRQRTEAGPATMMTLETGPTKMTALAAGPAALAAGPATMVALEAGPATMAAGPATMVALEDAVRERLGLCWMRRAGRRPRTNLKIQPSCPSAGFAVACGAP